MKIEVKTLIEIALSEAEYTQLRNRLHGEEVETAIRKWLASLPLPQTAAGVPK